MAFDELHPDPNAPQSFVRIGNRTINLTTQMDGRDDPVRRARTVAGSMEGRRGIWPGDTHWSPNTAPPEPFVSIAVVVLVEAPRHSLALEDALACMKAWRYASMTLAYLTPTGLAVGYFFRDPVRDLDTWKRAAAALVQRTKLELKLRGPEGWAVDETATLDPTRLLPRSLEQFADKIHSTIWTNDWSFSTQDGGLVDQDGKPLQVRTPAPPAAEPRHDTAEERAANGWPDRAR